MDRDIRVVHYEGTGELEIFVDGQRLPFAQAAAITRDFTQRVSAGIPGGLALRSAIESHKAGGIAHSHVVGHHKQEVG